MKHLKTYESVWSKNLKIGNIYVIDKLIIAQKEYDTNIPFGEIVDILKIDNTIVRIDMKTYIDKTHEKYIFEDFPIKLIKRNATKEEAEKFEIIEKITDYNI